MKRVRTHFCFCVLFCLCLAASFWWLPLGNCSDQYRLKLGARGPLCLKCHEEFQGKINSPYVHPLMKKGECTGCHTPHASSEKKLLAAELTRLCKDCHQDTMPADSKSAHTAAMEGNCTKCHDPHGTANPFMLTRSGKDLCLGCHQNISEEFGKNEFHHKPLTEKQGCLTCHYPHSSGKWNSLLRADARSLCVKCHDTTGDFFQKKHMNYPVANADCTTCHTPHSSAKRGLLYANTHDPVSKNQCTACHFSPGSPSSLMAKKQGIALCRECHQEMIDQEFNKNRVHTPLLDPTGCLGCHSPHASKKKGLLKGPAAQVCGECHADTVHLQKQALKNPKHKNWCEPVRTGDCVACHQAHSSDSVLRFKQSSNAVGFCGDCHEWQTHSSHPLGEKIIDPRNGNLSLDCLSCHKGCGTADYDMMLHYPTVYELCIQCHIDRKR